MIDLNDFIKRLNANDTTSHDAVKDIKFSYCLVQNNTSKEFHIRKDQPMLLDNILSISSYAVSKTNTNEYANVNMSIIENNKYMSIDDENIWAYWNKCTFEDIDYKNYINANETHVEPETMYNKVVNYMKQHYGQYFLYAEMSRSRKGFHFIFYYDVPRNKENYFRCKAISKSIIMNSFLYCGYYKEIKFNGVYDSHMNRVNQILYVTGIDNIVNLECNGEASKIKRLILEDYDDINMTWMMLMKRDASKHVDYTNEREKIKADIEKNGIYNAHNVDDVVNAFIKDEYICHHSDRRALWHSLAMIYDDETLLKEWEFCCIIMSATYKKYNYVDYYNLSKSMWNDRGCWSKPNTWLLRKFGYRIGTQKYKNI